MKSDTLLQKNVEDALNWEPSLAGTEISVAAKKGVITLVGFVQNYPQKEKAESTA